MMTRGDHTKTDVMTSPMAAQAFWLFGNHLTILADKTDTGGHYDLIEGRTPAGYQTPPHRHTRYQERFYAIDGEFTIWIGKRRVVLHRGETVTIPVGEAHVVSATGEGPAHGLVIASPSGFAGLIQEFGTADTGEPPAEPTPDDLERFDRASAKLGDEILGPPGALPEG